MRTITLSEGEWRLMNRIWDRDEVTLGELVEAMKDETGWTKSTVYMMLRRMTEKGVLAMDDTGKRQTYRALLAREDAQLRETKSFLDRVYQGSMRLMLSAMAGEQALSRAEIEELEEVLQKAKLAGEEA